MFFCSFVKKRVHVLACRSHYAEHVGDAVSTLLEVLAHHLLDEEIEFGAERYLQLTFVISYGEQLNPKVHGDGRTDSLKLNQLGRVALYDLEGDLPYLCAEGNGVFGKGNVFDLLLKLIKFISILAGCLFNLFAHGGVLHGKFDCLEIAEVREAFVNDIDVVGDGADFAFVFSHV